MPTTFERNLHLCFTKLKRHHSPPPPPPPPPPPSQHRHRHHHHGHRRHHSETTLIKNFNTLYDLPPASASDDDAASATTTAAADFSTVVASDRFFFSSPGRSNSIVDSSSSSVASTSFTGAGDGDAVNGGVAIPTISPDPYFDFRRSMQEMVEARDLIDVRADWGYLHELLTCYLDLNPKSAHKFIVGAFADLLVSLMAEDGARRRRS